jgi:hypothetical protein
MYAIAFVEQELGKVGAILTSYACYDGNLV